MDKKNSDNSFKLLTEDELLRLYNNKPLKTKSIKIVENKLVFGNYNKD